MISVNNLTFCYPGADGHAVEDISFDVAPGTITGLLGPSGAGKSTIQKIMIKLLPMQLGEVRYDGRELRELGRDFFNRVGVSFEHPNLFDKLTGEENLRYFAGLYDRDSLDAGDVLKLVGLEDAGKKRASDYSKGMKQRLVLARALQHKPDILFLDEPTSGLDPATAHKIMTLIGEQRDRGAAILLTTHNMTVAETLCDDLAILDGGRFVAKGAPRELKLEFGERAVEVEWRAEGGELEEEVISLDDPRGQERLSALMREARIERMHTREATLDQIFIELTGKELAA